MRIALLFAFIFSVIFCPAQDEKASDCPEPDNDKAVKLFKKSQDKKKYEYKERMGFLKQALDQEPDYPQAVLEYARHLVITFKNRGQNFKGAEKYYLQVISLCPNLHSDPYYYMAIISWEDENYPKAAEYAKKYMDFKSDDEKKFDPKFPQYLVDMKNIYKWSKLYDELFNNPVPYEPVLVTGLSSDRSEYLPIISPDNSMALFTRQVKPKSTTAWESDKIIERFMFSKKGPDGKFSPGDPMPEPFNQGTNEGGPSLTIDNKHLYFTICKDEGGAQMECDIYYSDFVEGHWTPIQKVENINFKDKWDSQPSISADGNTLYFSSDRPGGYGGVDIWYSVKGPDGKWGKPKNMGPKINTSGDEKAPFIHSDSHTLYFSSGPSITSGEGGWPGVGGLDVFYSRLDEKGQWMEPKNLGVPINTKGDEVGFVVSTDGKLVYFASEDPRQTKGKTLGGYDIYSFPLYEKARPEKVLFVEGDVKTNTGEPLKNPDIQLVDAVTKKTTKAVYDSVDGKYRAIIVDRGNDVLLKVKDKGYGFSSQLISKKDSAGPEKLIYKASIITDTLVKGKKFTLNNIYYKTGSAELDKKSLIVLEEFAGWLKENKQVKIEIHGHTDNVGKDADNMALSKDRAFTVMETLITMGVPKEQLTGFKGFGKTQPLVSNDTEQGRSKNRRTEFFITGN